MTRQRRRSKPMPQDKCKHEELIACKRTREGVTVLTGHYCPRCEGWFPAAGFEHSPVLGGIKIG